MQQTVSMILRKYTHNVLKYKVTLDGISKYIINTVSCNAIFILVCFQQSTYESVAQNRQKNYSMLKIIYSQNLNTQCQDSTTSVCRCFMILIKMLPLFLREASQAEITKRMFRMILFQALIFLLV